MDETILMKEDFWACNIDQRGRIARALVGLLFLAAGAVLWFKFDSVFWAIGSFTFGLVALFEGLRGWCIARAFGIRTPL